MSERNKLKQFSLAFDEDTESSVKVLRTSARDPNVEENHRNRNSEDDTGHEDNSDSGQQEGSSRGNVITKLTKMNNARSSHSKSNVINSGIKSSNRGTADDAISSTNHHSSDESEPLTVSNNYDATSIENVFTNRLNMNSRKKKIHQLHHKDSSDGTEGAVELISTSESQSGNIARVKSTAVNDQEQSLLPAFPAPIGLGDKTPQADAEFTTDGAGFVLTEDSSQEITGASSNVLDDPPTGPVSDSTGELDQSQNSFVPTRIIYQEIPVPVPVPVDEDQMITPFRAEDGISVSHHNERGSPQKMIPNVAYAPSSVASKALFNIRDSGNQHNNIAYGGVHFNRPSAEVSSAKSPAQTPPQHNSIGLDMSSTSMSGKNLLTQQQSPVEQMQPQRRTIKYESIQSQANINDQQQHHRHHHVNHQYQHQHHRHPASNNDFESNHIHTLPNRLKPQDTITSYVKSDNDQLMVPQTFMPHGSSNNRVPFSLSARGAHTFHIPTVNSVPQQQQQQPNQLYDERNILTPIIRAQAEAAHKSNHNGNKLIANGEMHASPAVGQRVTGKGDTLAPAVSAHKLPVFVKSNSDQVAASSTSTGYFLHNGQLYESQGGDDSSHQHASVDSNSRRSSTVEGEYSADAYATAGKESSKFASSSTIPLGMPVAGILLHQQRQKMQRRQSEPIVSLNKREIQSNEMTDVDSQEQPQQDELENVSARRQDMDEEDDEDIEDSEADDAEGDDEYDDGIVAGRVRSKRQIVDKETFNVYESPYLPEANFNIDPYNMNDGYPRLPRSDLYNFGGSRRRLTHSGSNNNINLSASGNSDNHRHKPHHQHSGNSNNNSRNRSHYRVHSPSSESKSYGILGSGNFEVIRGGILKDTPDKAKHKANSHKVNRKPNLNRNKFDTSDDSSLKFPSSFTTLDDDELFNSHKNPVLGFQGYDNFQLASNQEEDMKNYDSDHDEHEAENDHSASSSNLQPLISSHSSNSHHLRSMVSFDQDLMAIA